MKLTWKEILFYGFLVAIIFFIGIYFMVVDLLNYQAAIIEKQRNEKHPPHIIVIIGDDIGYSDHSFHGSNEVPTPNIDALGYNGIILDKFYTQPSCSPSRAAFLTGSYPFKIGMQGNSIQLNENLGLRLETPLMSEHLNRLGYKSHIVGKWHLGFATKEYTPTYRGFLSHFGYWNDYTGYFDYSSSFNGNPGFDLHNPFEPVWEAKNKYATDLFTEQSLKIIELHDKASPLFLIVSHLAAHQGGERSDLPVLNVTETNLKFEYIDNERRRRYAETVHKLDESVGSVVKKLEERRMLENSIILYFSDNGGATTGTNNNTASNWPLRGAKQMHLQGGVKGSAVMYSPLLKEKGYVNKQLIHLVDFLPTFYKAAGGNVMDLGQIDGINQWEMLSENTASKRNELVIDIDEVLNVSGIITDKGKYKLIVGNFTTFEAYVNLKAHVGAPGENTPPYNITEILESVTNQECQKHTPKLVDTKVKNLRLGTEIKCDLYENTSSIQCTEPGCLFDLEMDPCETTNLVGTYPEIARKLQERLAFHQKLLVPQKPRGVSDEKMNPKLYNNSWCTWLDSDWCVKTAK